MDIKNCIVIGAGNAGRPVAKLLNYLGTEVTMTDTKNLGEFTPRFQEYLKELEAMGITLTLGIREPDISPFEAIYFAPTIPESAPIRKSAEKSGMKVLSHDYISGLIDDILDMDKIGITGSFGKTTTTTMITNIFQAAGYNVYSCSSMKQNLVSEALVNDIIKGEHIGADIAILELPHGTIGLLKGLTLKIGVLTNVLPEHLSEFGGSMEKYAERKSVMLDMCETFIANCQCGDILAYKRKDTIYYNMKSSYSKDFDTEKYPPKFTSYFEDDVFHVCYEENAKAIDETFKLDSIANYNYENLTAAVAVAITYGLSMDDIKTGINAFESVGGRMEYLGNFNGADAYYDASFGPSIRQALEAIRDRNIIVVFGFLDTTTIRDKALNGKIVGDYANMVIATGYAELMGELNMDNALELLNAIENRDVIKLAVCDVEEASELAVKYAKKGDIIVHLGTGASNSYEEVKQKMLKGLNEGSKRYAGRN
ncbi:MAG: Mur ligase family protein [Methanosphaera sp.]|nr:Mur ligase family protein [Methanosphaera sp.]